MQEGRSNLECFLEHTTPAAQCRYPPETSIADCVAGRWKPHTEMMTQCMPFFNLSDLWSSFDEWSAYGAGVPLNLPSGETIVQYYVPYLSALQIYLHPGCNLLSKHRRPMDESDWSDACESRDTCSEFSSDNENDKVSRVILMKPDQWETASCASSERSASSVEEPTSEMQGDHHQGHLIFEYFERCSPYGRSPLREKISELAAQCPLLLSLHSNELSSASWVSVAWYPIYRIPTGPTMRDLSTCFLTFHSLWTPPTLQVGSKEVDQSESDTCDACDGTCDPGAWALQREPPWRVRPCGMVLDLPAFGLASYKLRGPFWASAAPADKRRASSLASSADSWLRQLKVQHPDFNFFASRH